MVLGADQRSIVSQVLREGLWLVAAGTVAGVCGAFAAARVMSSLLTGLETLSPTVLVAGVVILGFCTLIACAVPARRASRIEPAEALRER